MSNPKRSGNPAVRASAREQAELAARIAAGGEEKWLKQADGILAGPPPGVTQPGLPGIPPDVLRMMEQRLQVLTRQNVTDIQQLQASGIGFDKLQVIDGRIDVLMQSIAQVLGPDGQVWLLQAKISFEEAMAQNVATAKREGIKAQLAAGAGFSAGSIRNLARQTGTYGGR